MTIHIVNSHHIAPGAQPSRPVLARGCSSGIGHAAALALARAGFPVWASARNAGGLGELEAAGCRVLELDVTDERSRTAAVLQVEAEHGAVGILINNAGHGGGGPVEEVPLEIVRETFETNVFAVIRLCQLVLPRMRAQRSGLIVNLGSAAGLVTPPTGCPYAMESLCDALRPEVAPFGIRVTLIQPGAVRTRFMANSELHQPGDTGDSLYAAYKANVARMAPRAPRRRPRRARSWRCGRGRGGTSEARTLPPRRPPRCPRRDRHRADRRARRGSVLDGRGQPAPRGGGLGVLQALRRPGRTAGRGGRAAGLLGELLGRQAASGSPEHRLAAAAETYVRFADEHRALFQALAGSGLDKARYPEIGRAAQPISAAFLSPAAELVGGDKAAAGRLVSAIVATAHGHAMLMLDGTFGSGQQAADAAAQAATATLALVAGREVLG
jgi:NAD(P)-dependent dehydrogenase (short-subunit alcohol dehydrogenase family)